MEFIKRENITVKLANDTFYMSNAVFSSESWISEVKLLSGYVSRTVTGGRPLVISLTGSILPNDREFYQKLIKTYSGNMIPSINIDGKNYSNLILTKGNCYFDNKSFLGKCVLQLISEKGD